MRTPCARLPEVRTVLKKRAAVVALALVSVTACTTGGTPNPAPGATTSSGSSSAPADPNVPEVSQPALDVSAYEGDPCKTVPSATLSGLGYADPGKPHVGAEDVEKAGPACSWMIRGTGRSVQVILGTGNRAKGQGGLAGIYQAKNRFRFIEPASDIEGYPVVYADTSDRRSSGECNLQVGVADDLAIAVQASGYEGRQDSCDAAQQSAAAVVKTLKGV